MVISEDKVFACVPIAICVGIGVRVGGGGGTSVRVVNDFSTPLLISAEFPELTVPDLSPPIDSLPMFGWACARCWMRSLWYVKHCPHTSQADLRIWL